MTSSTQNPFFWKNLVNTNPQAKFDVPMTELDGEQGCRNPEGMGGYIPPIIWLFGGEFVRDESQHVVL